MHPFSPRTVDEVLRQAGHQKSVGRVGESLNAGYIVTGSGLTSKKASAPDAVTGGSVRVNWREQYAGTERPATEEALAAHLAARAHALEAYEATLRAAGYHVSRIPWGRSGLYQLDVTPFGTQGA